MNTTTTGNTSAGYVMPWTIGTTTVGPLFPEAEVWRMVGEAFERYGNGEPLYRGYSLKVGDYYLTVVGMISAAINDIVAQLDARMAMIQRIASTSEGSLWLPPGRRYALRRAMYCYLLAESVEPAPGPTGETRGTP